MKKIMLAIAVAAIATFSVNGASAHTKHRLQTEQAPAKEKKAEKAPKKHHAKKAATKKAVKPVQQ